MRLTVVDLDASLIRQREVVAWISARSSDLIDCRDIASRLRMVASRTALVAFSNRIAALRTPDQPAAVVNFFGSGDFHHLTFALLQGLTVPVTVVNFDNHPDWVKFPPLLTCGTWVHSALGLAEVVRMITIGPCSQDFHWPEIKTANLDAIRSGRLEIYPWRQIRSRIWGRPVEGASVKTSNGWLIWRSIANDWQDFFGEIAERIPTQAVWISIDKDVLSAEEAITNWDQGEMTLDQILFAIAKIAEHHRIIGIDVFGDYSKARFRDPMRAGIALFDRPFMRPPMVDPSIINGRTNERLAAGLREILA